MLNIERQGDYVKWLWRRARRESLTLAGAYIWILLILSWSLAAGPDLSDGLFAFFVSIFRAYPVNADDN